MTSREISILDCTVDATYLTKVCATVATGEIQDQITYHKSNAERMHNVEEKLERIGFWSFFLPFAICGIEALLLFLHIGAHLPGWLTILTVVLPALGASLFGIRVHGDFQGASERSADMAVHLQALLDRLVAGREWNLSELSALTEYAVVLMASELGDWGVSIAEGLWRCRHRLEKHAKHP